MVAEDVDEDDGDGAEHAHSVGRGGHDLIKSTSVARN